jgi:hypothetical protein
MPNASSSPLAISVRADTAMYLEPEEGSNMNHTLSRLILLSVVSVILIRLANIEFTDQEPLERVNQVFTNLSVILLLYDSFVSHK